MAKWSDENRQGGVMNAHWTDEQIVAEMRRLVRGGYSEVEAALLVFYHGFEPLLELAKDELDVRAEVSSYEESRYRIKREAREKRERSRRS